MPKEYTRRLALTALQDGGFIDEEDRFAAERWLEDFYVEDALPTSPVFSDRPMVDCGDSAAWRDSPLQWSGLQGLTPTDALCFADGAHAHRHRIMRAKERHAQGAAAIKEACGDEWPSALLRVLVQWDARSRERWSPEREGAQRRRKGLPGHDPKTVRKRLAEAIRALASVYHNHEKSLNSPDKEAFRTGKNNDEAYSL